MRLGDEADREVVVIALPVRGLVADNPGPAALHRGVDHVGHCEPLGCDHDRRANQAAGIDDRGDVLPLGFGGRGQDQQTGVLQPGLAARALHGHAVGLQHRGERGIAVEPAPARVAAAIVHRPAAHADPVERGGKRQRADEQDAERGAACKRGRVHAGPASSVSAKAV